MKVSRSEFTKLSMDLLAQAHMIRFTALGYSMQPEINHEDIVTIEPAVAPSVNEIVLFINSARRPIVHRIIQMKVNQAGEHFYLLRGDANRYTDGWISEKQIMGRVVSVERCGKRKPRWLYLFRAVRKIRSAMDEVGGL